MRKRYRQTAPTNFFKDEMTRIDEISDGIGAPAGGNKTAIGAGNIIGKNPIKSF